MTSIREFGGLKTNSPASTIGDNEFAILQNVEFTPQKTIRKRKGVRRLTVSGASWSTGNFRILGRQTTDTIDKLLWTDSSKLYRSELDGSVMTEILLTGASIPACTDMFQWIGNSVYICRSGVGLPVIAVNPAGVATAGGVVAGTTTVLFKDRMFLASTLNTSNEARLYYSQVADTSAGTGFPGTNIIDVNPGDGQPIVALQVFNDALYIFKSKSTFMLAGDGPSTWSLRKVHDSIGCIGHKTVKIIEGLMYFVSIEGVYRTDGITWEEISLPIRDFFASASYTSRSSMAVTWSAYYDNKYIYSPQGSTAMYVFDLVNEAWSKWVFNANIVPFGLLALDDLNPPRLIMGGYGISNPYVLGGSVVWDDQLSNGSLVSYAVDIQTGQQIFGDPTNYKRHMFLAVDGVFSPTIVGVDYDKDESGSINSHVLAFSGVDTYKYARTTGAGRFRWLQTRIGYSGDGDFELRGIHHALLPSDNVGNAH